MVEQNILDDFISAVKQDNEQTNDVHSAVVSRIDKEGTVWVRVAGSDSETPTQSTSSEVKRDDVVNVEWRNKKLYIVGNSSNPAAGMIRVDAVERAAQVANNAASSAVADAATAREAAESVQGIAVEAKTAATQAQNSLKSVVQGATTVEKAVSVMQTALEAMVDYDPQNDTVQEYFWHDANGAHVLGNTSGYRNDIDSTGMDIVKVSDEKSYAKFSANGARIGKEYEDGGSNENNMRITKDSIGYYKDGSVNNPVFFIGTETRENLLFNIGLIEVYEPTTETVTIDGYCEPHGDYFYLQPREGGLPEIEVSVEDLTVTHSSDTSTGNNTTSFTFEYGEGIMGVSIYYDITDYAPHFEFSDIERKTDQTTVGEFSANFGASYSEGRYSFAEGEWSHAIGLNSHAEGFLSVARGNDSHAQNAFTVANGNSQTAIGSANIADTTSVFIIGNGQSDTRRSNALTVDWSGNVEASGDITDGSGNVLSAKADASGLIDLFYPVGSYYETSDTTFDPNVSWGGTWSLETEGLVHIGAGNNYTVGATGGAKTVKLTKAQSGLPSHGHGFTRPTVKTGGGGHSHTVTVNYRNAVPTNGNSAQPWAAGTLTSTGTATIASGTGTHSHTLEGGSVSNNDGADASSAHNNMQPYVVVNRWHRTA